MPATSCRFSCRHCHSRLSPIACPNCEFEKCNAIDGSRPHKFPANKSLSPLSLSPSLCVAGRCNPRPAPTQVQMPITMISINVQARPISFNKHKHSAKPDQVRSFPALPFSASPSLSKYISLSLSLFASKC